MGIHRAAWIIEKVDSFEIAKNEQPDIILVDEAQFLDESEILKLVKIVDFLDIPVRCYGLKTDFKLRLFKGSELLLCYADTIKEIECICTFCKRKAIANMRLINNVPIFDGEQIFIGGNKRYIVVCRKCYMDRYRSIF